MIEILVKAGSHTIEEIRQRLRHFFRGTTNPEKNIDEFLLAMEVSGQLKRRGDRYITSQRPGRIRRTAITETQPTISAGGRERVGVHLPKGWEEEHGHPVRVYLTAVRGTPIPPVRLKELTPRPSEAWRAEIPAEIRRRYDIKRRDEVTFTIESIKETGWQTLKLWGYSLRPAVTFEYKRTRRGMREMELIVTNIPFEVSRDIQEDVRTAIDKAQTLMRRWLKDFDVIYGSFFDEETIKKTWGTPTSPLTKKPSIAPTIRFTDLDRGITIAEAVAELPEGWAFMPVDDLVGHFSTTIDLVAHEIKSLYRRAEHYTTLEGF